MSDSLIFDKPALTIEKQLEKLSSRGLIITDKEKSLHYLTYIGYYRFSGYLHPFKQADKTYKPGTSFDNVLDTYIFDRKLRMITLDAIERIEIALRTCITNTMSEKFGPHWFQERELFSNFSKFSYILKEIYRKSLEKGDKKGDTFICHYYKTYEKPVLPPSWMVMEILSMSDISRLYKYLKPTHRKTIASYFFIDEEILQSWIHALVYTRNLCAHHSRLWNRIFTVTPKRMKRYHDKMQFLDKFSAQSLVIHILLDAIAPEHGWNKKLKGLFHEHPSIKLSDMGF